MGGLRILGRQWRLADDDLVLPAFLEFFTRLAGLVLSVSALLYELSTADVCGLQHHLDIYLWVAVLIFALALVNVLAIALYSAKGSVWDENKRIRGFVVPLVYVNVVLTIAELVWLVLGTFWIVSDLFAKCVSDINNDSNDDSNNSSHVDNVSETSSFSNLDDSYVLSNATSMWMEDQMRQLLPLDFGVWATIVLIVSNWIGLIIKLLLLLCLGTQSSSESHKQQDCNKGLLQQSRSALSSLCWFVCCCFEKRRVDAFKEVATVLSDIFDDDSFVPTDIAAALVLLYAQSSLMMRSSEGEDEDNNDHAKLTSVLSQSSLSSDYPELNWDSPSVVSNFLPFAGSAYGSTWFVMRHSLCTPHLTKLYPHLMVPCGCCCCPCMRPMEDFVTVADDCCRCNTAALRATLEHLDDEAMVHVSFSNKLMEVPFFVAADHKTKTLVISIRGTLSLHDFLTDFCARPEAIFNTTNNNTKQTFMAHRGILRAARYVMDELKNKHILDKALCYFDGYTIVTTGHSLGAGVAIVLAFLLRPQYPSTRCYAFAPPGALLNESASKESANFAIAVVQGHDLVPRLSFQSITVLKQQMKDVLRACPLPKYKILASGLAACCVKTDWRKHLDQMTTMGSVGTGGDVEGGNNLGSEDPILGATRDDANRNYEAFSTSPQNSLERVETPVDDLAHEQAMLNELSPRTRRILYDQMLLPSRIWHLEETDYNCYTLNRERSVIEMQEIIISPKMLSDHFPNNMCDVFQKIVSQQNSQ